MAPKVLLFLPDLTIEKYFLGQMLEQNSRASYHKEICDQAIHTTLEYITLQQVHIDKIEIPRPIELLMLTSVLLRMYRADIMGNGSYVVLFPSLHSLKVQREANQR